MQNGSISQIYSLGLILILLGCGTSGKVGSSLSAQKVDKSINKTNYYSYISSRLVTTNWLREHEATPIIAKELEAMGYSVLQNVLYETDEGVIKLSIFCREKNKGILFIPSHYVTPKKEHRETLGLPIRFFIYSSDGKARKNIINTVPSNVSILQENWYWYQYANSETKTTSEQLLNRATIIEILKEDVRRIVKSW